MMDNGITNRTLAMLLVAAIVVSIGGTLISLNKIGQLGGPSVTGFATFQEGQVNLTIATTVSILIDTNQDYINFGACTTDNAPTYDSNSTLTYPGPTNCTGMTGSRQYFNISNDGNVDAQVNLTLSSNDAAGFIGGTTPVAPLFNIAGDHASDTCTGASTAWVAIINGAQNTELCPNLSSPSSYMHVALQVRLPLDATTDGAPDVETLRFTAVSIE